MKISNFQNEIKSLMKYPDTVDLSNAKVVKKGGEIHE